ncbi:mucin-17-like isoform X1 [Oreochromis niloticus]|uniref:mucin-17-like isoform X1 n=1 Tax=Oreochromis niloticus TaxID=8128 RepID=UPI000DF33DA2|nr:mucin-17-like isoform X1 [Oreochromis niloticus]
MSKMPESEEKNRIEMTEKSSASGESSKTSTICLAYVTYEIHHFSNVGTQEETCLPKVTPNPGQKKEEMRNKSKRVGRSCLCAVPTGSLPKLPQKPACRTGPKPATVTVKTRMVPDRKRTQNNPNQQNLSNLSKRPGSKCPVVISTGLSPTLARRPLPDIPSKAPTVSANTRKHIPVNLMVPDRKRTQNHPNQQNLSNLSKRPGSKCPAVIPTGLSPMVAQRPLPRIPSKAPTVSTNTRKNIPVNLMVPDRKRTQNHPNQQNLSNLSKRPGSKCPAVIPTGLSPMVAQRPLPRIPSKASTVSTNTRKNIPVNLMVPDRKRTQNHPNQQNLSNLSKRPGSKCPGVIPTGLSPMLAQRPLPRIPSKAPTVNVNTRKTLPVKHHMVQGKKVSSPSKSLPNSAKDTVNRGKSQNMFTDKEVVQTAATMKEELSVPVLSESPFHMTKKTCSQTISAHTVQDLPIENNELDRTDAAEPITDGSLSTNICKDNAEVVSAGSELESTDSENHDEKPKGKIGFQKFKRAVTKQFHRKKKATGSEMQSIKGKTRFQNFKRAVKKQFQRKKIASSEVSDEESASPESMLTNDEVVQGAAFMKEQLSESPLDMTKKTCSQTISDHTVQDLPIENNELDRTDAAEPITDGSLSTNICKDNAEVVSAGSELESTDSENHDEKPKGKIGFQKFKRAVTKQFHRKKKATGSEMQSIKGKTRFQNFKRAVKKQFQRKKIASSEVSDEESASPESMLTNDEVVQGAAFMKEQLSESPLDMTKKTSSQTISDQTVQDLPTENDEPDRTNAGQLFTDGSLSTNVCDEDTTGKSLLKSGKDNKKYIDESQNTVFSEVFQKVSGDLYSLKMHIDFWKAKYASSVNADEFVEKETQQYLQTFFERRLAESSCGILKKKSSQTTPNTTSPEAPDDETARQSSGSPELTLTDDETMHAAATMKEQLSVPVLSENALDMTKKTSTQTVQDLPTEHDELDNTKAGQPITDNSLSTDSCEDHSEDVSAGSELESMSSESHDEKPKGKTPFQKLKRAVKKLFHKKKIATRREVQSTDSESQDETPKRKTRLQKMKRAVKKPFHKEKTSSSEAPDDESARQSSASPESTLTDDETTQAAATVKEQLSVPVLSENALDMTKKTSTQTLSDQTVQDLPTEHDEPDNTKAGQPITDNSLSTDSCEDHPEDVSAGSELESMASESHDEKPKGKTPFQKFKRAVKKLFHKKKTSSPEAPDDETARQSSGSPESTLTDDETTRAAATMKEQLSVPVLSENALDTTKKTSTQTLSDQTVQDLPTEHDEPDNTKAGQPITDNSLSTDSCEDHSEDVSAGSELESMASESHDEKPKGKTPFQKFKRAVKKLFHKKKTSSPEAPDDETARQSSGSPESTLTDDETTRAAATMKEQLSVPVLSENALDTTKKTSTQTLSDQRVQDLPTEHDEFDNTKAGQPITDNSMSTDSCEDHSEDVSAGSELESMVSESHDEKPKGKTPFQKLKRAVLKRFQKKKIATRREVQSTDSESQDETPKRKTRLQKLKKAVKKLFHKKKSSSSEAPDDESAHKSSGSPESTLTDDETTRTAATMKEQLSVPVLSENALDMTKKTSTQTLSDQMVQDLPTEHDKPDNTKAGQPITDSSMSTESCEDHSGDVSAGSELESMASESHDEKPKGKTPFQKLKRAVLKRFHKKKIATRREVQSTDSESQDETPKRKTRLQKLKRAVKKLFHKKKTSSSEAPDDESARQSSASPESTLTDDETTQAAATIQEQLSQPVMSENALDMTKKTSTQTLSDQTVQDLPTEHDKPDNTKAGQPITDSSMSTDSCEDHSGDVSAGSELESMASESHDEKPKGKTPFQKLKRAVIKRFHKKKIATRREVQSTDSESQDETQKRKTRLQKFHKKKIATADAPDDRPLTSNTFKTEAEGLAEEAKCSLNEEIDIEAIKRQFTEVCVDVLKYIRDSSITLSSQSNYDLPH